MDRDLELVILGELLHADKQERLDALIELKGLSFGKYQSLFNTIEELSITNKEVDTVTIYQSNKDFTAKEISDLYHNTISSAYLKQHIYLFKSGKHKDEIKQILNSNLKELEGCQFGEDIEEIKNSLIIELSSVSLEDRSEFDSISHYKTEIKNQLNSDKKIEGYSWGISDLDKWTSGVVIPRVYVLGGLKKSGKTRFVIKTLKELHDQKIPTVFLSLEMPAYEVTKLLISSATLIEDVRFRSGSYLSSEQKYAFDNTVFDEDVLKLECKSGLNLQNILSRVRRYAKLGYKVIAIDYIQRIQHNRHNQAQELEDISIKLSDAARQHSVSLLLLSQLNAMGEREIPNMGHLKGSGGIGESADVILLLDNLYRRTKKSEDRNRIDVYIEQRHGDSGLLKLQCDLGKCQFNNLLPTVDVEEQNEIF